MNFEFGEARNDFAIFYQLPNHSGTFLTVPSDRVEAEVQRLESEGAQVTAVIPIFDCHFE